MIVCDNANKYTGMSSNENCSLRCVKASSHSCLLLAIWLFCVVYIVSESVILSSSALLFVSFTLSTVALIYVVPVCQLFVRVKR